MAILTISREFGSGGREIGHAVAEFLHYEYIDKQNILSDLKSAGIEWGKWGKDLDEHCPTLWEKYDWSFRGFSALLQSCILDHAVRGKIVVMGRGGNFLLKDITSSLRVRIVAPIDKRVERIMTRESIDRQTARWLAEKTDNDRACFIRSVYGGAWDDPNEYDIICDTSKRDEKEIIKLITENLLEKDQVTEGFKTLQLRSEAAKLKAALLTNPKLSIPTLDVYHEGETIVLRGVVHNAKEHKAVEEEAIKLAKGLSIRCSLHYRK
jgi:hypothetical protein